MRERLGTPSAKYKPKIFQSVLWEATAINAREPATARLCLLVVGTLQPSQRQAQPPSPPTPHPLSAPCLRAGCIIISLAKAEQVRACEGLSDVSQSSWPSPLAEDVMVY